MGPAEKRVMAAIERDDSHRRAVASVLSKTVHRALELAQEYGLEMDLQVLPHPSGVLAMGMKEQRLTIRKSHQAYRNDEAALKVAKEVDDASEGS